MSYLGPFTQQYRQELEETWQNHLLKLGIPHTPGCNLMLTLKQPVLVREWNIQGLPSVRSRHVLRAAYSDASYSTSTLIPTATMPQS